MLEAWFLGHYGDKSNNLQVDGKGSGRKERETSGLGFQQSLGAFAENREEWRSEKPTFWGENVQFCIRGVWG